MKNKLYKDLYQEYDEALVKEFVRIQRLDQAGHIICMHGSRNPTVLQIRAENKAQSSSRKMLSAGVI